MNKKSTLLLVSALGVVFGSCNKLVDGYDINPNTALDAPSTLQLTAAELAHGFFMSGEAARTASIWAGVFTGSDRQYSALQTYITSATDYDGMWQLSYQTTMAQLRLVENKAQAVGNKQLLGIAQVVEAQMLGTTTALWGDVPYSQAFQEGKPGTFDAQATVYAATQALLTDAITNLTSGGNASIPNDIYFTGNKAKWLAVAHTLKARYFLHVKNYALATAEARLGMNASTGDMAVPFGGAIGSSANTYYSFLTNDRVAYLSAADSYAAQLLLQRTNAKTREAVRYRYFYNDKDTTGTTTIFSKRDPNWIDGAFQADSPFPLVSYAENQAILAESLILTADAPGALTALNSIRTNNQNTYTGPDARYDAYTPADFNAGGLLNPTASGQSSAQALHKEILTEKYLSLVGQIEEFNDVRRTGNIIGVPRNATNAPDLPQRFLYPQSELNTNPSTPSPIPGLFVKTTVNQ